MGKALVFKGITVANPIRVVTLQPDVRNLSISNKTFIGKIGDTLQLAVTTAPIIDSKYISYTSSNDSVANVSTTGLVTLVGDGKCTITAECSGIYDTVDVQCKVMPQMLTTYFSKLSQTPTEEQQDAFYNIYEAIKNAGAVDNIMYFYPYYSPTNNAKDLKYGVKGADLAFLNGTKYTKGLDLSDVTGGGVGPSGKGIKLFNLYDNFDNLKDLEVFSATSDKVANNLLSIALEINKDNTDNPGDIVFVIKNYISNNGKLGLLTDYVNVPNYKEDRPIAIAWSAKTKDNGYLHHSAYYNGTKMNFSDDFVDATSGENSMIRYYKSGYIGSKSSAFGPQGYMTMLLVLNKALTDEQTISIQNAIMKADNILYGANYNV